MHRKLLTEEADQLSTFLLDIWEFVKQGLGQNVCQATTHSLECIRVLGQEKLELLNNGQPDLFAWVRTTLLTGFWVWNSIQSA